MKKVRDYYFHQARKKGYVARSAFKLGEMDHKFRLLRRGQCLLDLGCAPGSWLQYAAERVLPGGTLVGLDMKPVTLNLPKVIQIHQKDIYELEEGFFEGLEFDIVLSDMAPSTTGIRSLDSQRSNDLNVRALLLARRHLKTGGCLVLKVFQGQPLDRFKTEFRFFFDYFKLFKPRSSRNESVEIFLLGFGLKSRK